MRFSLNIGMCDPTHYAPLAQKAEAAGFHSIAVPDSLCFPKDSDTKYPYTEDGGRAFLDGDQPFRARRRKTIDRGNRRRRAAGCRPG